MSELRKQVIRLAYQRPELRSYLLPLLSCQDKSIPAECKLAAYGKPLATFRKTREGDWVVMMPASQARSGRKVQVSKRDGGMKEVTITAVRHPFRVGDELFVYCDFSDSRSTPTAPNLSWQVEDRVCANCGTPLRGKGTPRVDSNGIPGLVCPTCSQDSRWELSFA